MSSWLIHATSTEVKLVPHEELQLLEDALRLLYGDCDPMIYKSPRDSGDPERWRLERPTRDSAIPESVDPIPIGPIDESRWLQSRRDVFLRPGFYMGGHDGYVKIRLSAHHLLSCRTTFQRVGICQT